MTISDKISPNDVPKGIKKYQFIDKDLKFNGWHHYRVRQVDFDGSETYSKTVSIQNEIGLSLSVYPNPTVNEINISLGLENETDVEINVLDIKGKVIADLSYNGHLDEGSYVVPFELKNLPAGVYTFNINLNGTITSKVIVKE